MYPSIQAMKDMLPTGVDTNRPKPEQQPGPLQQKRMMKVRPPRSYYWPQEPPTFSQNSSPHSSPAQRQLKCSVADPALPKRIISTPRSQLEAMYPPVVLLPRQIPRQMNPAFLMPSSAQLKLSSQAQGRKTKTFPLLAPKPSLFSYNVCTCSGCPIERTHEAGTLNPGGAKEECISRELDALGVSMSTLRLHN